MTTAYGKNFESIFRWETDLKMIYSKATSVAFSRKMAPLKFYIRKVVYFDLLNPSDPTR